MKFGKRLKEKASLLPKRYAEACLDYDALKRFLKPFSSLNFNGQEKEPLLYRLLQARLSALSEKTPAFLQQLDLQVSKISDFFLNETLRLIKDYESSTSNLDDNDQDGATSPHLNALEGLVDARTKSSLQGVLRLEKFLFLNFTGITKILKKHDKITGLALSEAYLVRLARLPFYRSDNLTALKRSLMDSLAGNATAQSAVSLLEAVPSLTIPACKLEAMRGRGSSNNIAASLPGILNGAELAGALLPQQRVLISLSGPHGTDIIGCVLECAARRNCEIEDFMLARLYHQVTFGVLVRLSADQVDIFKDLAEAARRWDGELAFEVHDPQDTLPKSMDEAPYTNRIKYAATVLNATGLTSSFLDEWMKLLLEKKISVEKMMRLNEGRVSCAEFRLSVPGDTDMEELRTTLFTLSSKHATDVALQPNDVFRRNKRLVVFDMDSTLIQQEVIDEIARHAGVVEEVAKITELAMNGEIQFKESLRRRVALLKDTPTQVIESVKDALVFTEGARFLCRALKKLGFKLAVISGGFMPLALHVKSELQLDYAFANQLKTTPDGRFLTGETVGPIVDGARKAELLEVIAQAESVTLDQVIAVGDGANDLWMLNAAGLGIAFNAKIFLQKNARARINQKSLRHVLYLLGYSDEETRGLGEEEVSGRC